MGGHLLTEWPGSMVVSAQSTGGDTLPTPTPTLRITSSPIPGPPQSSTTIPQIWVARLASNTLGVTEGNGSIFRVSVEGQIGTRIELRSGDQLIFAESGSKPEYGPYSAEFAPVTKGTWLVSVPSLGVSIPVEADNYNLAVIEFVLMPVTAATQTAMPGPTETPQSGQTWEGRLAAEEWGIGAPFSRLLVQVTGLSGHPVRISTPVEEINTAPTGQKPREWGPDVVEFTGLTPARYIIEPLGLNVRFEIELKANTETRVEFSPVAPPPTSTPLPTPTQPLPPTATFTPLPPAAPTPTETSTPTPTPIPSPTGTSPALPSPTPVTRWLGTIESRNDLGTGPAVLAVRVVGIEGLPVRLRPMTGGNVAGERRCITGQRGNGQDVCAFRNLAPGQYMVNPEGLSLSLPVTVFEHEEVQVLFDLQVLAAGITGWQAELLQNSNSSQAVDKAESTIRVRVDGQAGQVAALRSARGTERFCEVSPNPVLGTLACEFGQLGPGVYLVEAVNTSAGLRLFVDGNGTAEVFFSPSATYATQAVSQSPPVVGWGAQVASSPAATPAPSPVAVRIVSPAAPVMPTPTWTPFPTRTATPAFAWQGRVIQVVDQVIGTIGVRAVGLQDHPVILRSGDWQSQVQLTGTKPELGDYATEFGGLAQGDYTVELVGLAELKVNLGPDQFILVEFRYDFVNPPQID